MVTSNWTSERLRREVTSSYTCGLTWRSTAEPESETEAFVDDRSPHTSICTSVDV